MCALCADKTIRIHSRAANAFSARGPLATQRAPENLFVSQFADAIQSICEKESGDEASARFQVKLEGIPAPSAWLAMVKDFVVLEMRRRLNKFVEMSLESVYMTADPQIATLV